jgi:hypothetical protein
MQHMVKKLENIYVTSKTANHHPLKNVAGVLGMLTKYKG